jgi:hypothetical protein
MILVPAPGSLAIVKVPPICAVCLIREEAHAVIP